jgi:hypothetical protein
MIFWQLLAEEIAVCSDNYANNHRRSQELYVWGPDERRRREFEGLKEPREWGAGGVFPSPLGEGSGEGAINPPQKIFEFFIWKLCLLVDSGALKLKVA